MLEIILDLNLMLEATQEQETMLVVLLQVIVKLEVIQDVNNIKRYSLLNIFLFWGKLLLWIR